MSVAILKFVGISVAIYLVIAVGLILSQWPKGVESGDGLDFDKLAIKAGYEPQPLQVFQARDGVELGVRVHESGAGDVAAPLVILVHGSGAFGAGYDWMAAELANRGARVLVPDLRGHGTLTKTRGDVAYVGQLEDDLADLIAAYKTDGQKVVLAGHSSGGGLVVRFAGGAHGEMLDGAVLMAPFLKYNAPMMRENSGGWAHVLVRRTIGLSMLNSVGITLLNGVTAIEFNLPDGVDGMTGAYSYRLNTSFAPRSDYLADVAALPPFLLVVGRQDEAFQAELFEPTLKEVTDRGEYAVLDGVSHLDVFLQDQTVDLIATYLDGLK